MQDETMMQCRDIDDLMVEFLYQELEGERLAAFQQHVDGCARCGAEMKSLMRTRQALRALPEAEPSPAVSARLLHEAAKRAPAGDEQGGGVLAWIAKLFGPIAAHPAWAAAASLLLVATVAGLLTVRARMDGSMRPEIPAASAPAAPAAAPSTPAEAAAPPPRDVAVGGTDDGARAQALEGVLEEKRRAAAGEKAGSTKDVREVGDKAPDPYPRKVAAPAAAPPPAKKGKVAPGPLDDSVDRYGRTASNEEDLKLAEPTAKKPAARPQPAKEEAQASADSDLGGVAASPPPPPPPSAAPEPQAPSGAAQGYSAPLSTTTAAPSQRESAGGGARRDEQKNAAAIEQERAPSAPPADAPAQTQALAKNKADTRAAPKVPPEQELLQKAQKLATTGRCGEALGTRDQIARMNPEFYRKRVAGDTALRSCEEQSKRNRAPVRQLKDPAAADESTTEQVTK